MGKLSRRCGLASASIVIGVIAGAGASHAQTVPTGPDSMLLWEWLTGFGAKNWTFSGQLICPNPNILGGCLPNGLHQFTYFGLTEQQCLVYKDEADALRDRGGNGGICLK